MVTVQPFSIGGLSGGAKIFRTLLEGHRSLVASVVTGAQSTTLMDGEVRVPMRPSLGRIESTRFSAVGDVTDLAAFPFLGKRVRRVIAQRRANVVHGLALGLDFAIAHRAATAEGAKFVLSVHDDFQHYVDVRPFLRPALPALRRAWRTADLRVVITDAMGQEYSSRYGNRTYVVVTDGMEAVAPRPRTGWDLYFMGSLHQSYRPNFAILAEVMRAQEVPLTLTARCGALPDTLATMHCATVLPFGTDADVAEDLTSADIAYLPLPFDDAYRAFVDLSLSTKMVTYLAHGLPILCHAPATSAASKLLSEADAGIVVPSLDPGELRRSLLSLTPDRRASMGANALRLAQERFDPAAQRARFWSAVAEATQTVT